MEDNRKDPAWKYSDRDENNKTCFTCKFCQKRLNGGVCRVKQHLAGGFKNVKKCPSCPGEVREECRVFMSEKKKAKDQYNVIDIDDMVDDEDYEDEENDPRSAARYKQGSSNLKKPQFKKPRTEKNRRSRLLLHPDAEVAVEARKGKQKKIDENDPYRKELKKRAHQKIARFLYDCGVPLNVVNSPSFGPMIEAIGNYGPGLPPPTYHQVRNPLLKEEKEHVNKMMVDHVRAREHYGCTLMCDGWTDKKSRTLINFLVNSPRGTMFLDSVDSSSYAKDAHKIQELLEEKIEEIGASNVVQVVTDSAAANKLAGKYLEQKYPNLFWSPCAAHCLDLMLEDIFKIPNLQKTWERAIRVHVYIYNRPTLLNMMRYFTQKKELVKPAKTRFATAFLTLQRFHLQKSNLRKMFVSDEWTQSKYGKEAQGKKVAEIIMMPSFWNNIALSLKFASPLVHVLRIVDGEEKPPMGYIYEAMDKAKEAIANAFQNNESKYKEVYEIIDRRWDVQLHQPLHAAGFFLNPEFFYKDPDTCGVNSEIYRGLYVSIERLVASTQLQDQVCNELDKYRKAEGLFGMPMAVRQRTTRVPADWWAAYGSETPELQKFAIKVLSLICSSSGCERNWSVFEHIHTKKRNKLDHKRLNDLVFIKYNRALQRRYTMRGQIDPIALNEIDESNEWLVGISAEEEIVFGTDDLNWNDVAMAAGVGEPSNRTRSTTRRGVETLSRGTRRGAAAAAATRTPSSMPMGLIDEDDEWEEDLGDDEGEEEDVDGYQSNDDEEIDITIDYD